MLKRDRKYVALLVLAIGLAVAAELAAPTPLDWTLSFRKDDARPYGCRVLFDLLDDLVPGAAVEASTRPAYLVAQEARRAGASYLFVTETFAPDEAEARKLIAFAARGHTVFVAAYAFEGLLADTLRLDVVRARQNVPAPRDVAGALLDADGDSIGVNLVNPALRAEADYFFEEGLADDYFGGFDTLRTTVLGLNSRGQANYVRVDVGQGAFLLSTLPVAFTNYYALHRGHAGYIYRTLSYLPAQDVLWDEYYKPNRLDASTPLRFVLRDPALRGAYWTLVALVLFFILFEARRRQRVIPVIPPPTNTTVAFVETVGRLYFQHADHANLAEKKVTYFLEYVRHHLGLPTHTLDEVFYARVAERSGVPAADVRAVFRAVERVHGRAKLSEDDLRLLNDRIEDFYRRSTRGRLV